MMPDHQTVTKSSNNNPSVTFSDSGGERCKYKCEDGFVILFSFFSNRMVYIGFVIRPLTHPDDCPKQTGMDKLSITLD